MKILPQNEFLSNIARTTDGKRDPKLLKAIQDFEAIFVNYMLKSMRQTVPESELTEEAPGKDFYMSIFDQEIAKSISTRQSDALVTAIYRQLTGESPQFQTSPSPPPVYSVQKSGYCRQNTYERVNHYSPIIQDAAEKYNVDQHLIAAVMAQESAGNTRVVSSKGACGLMQLMPETAKEMGVNNIFDPRENIFGGAKYLSFMLKKFDGDLSLTLAAYNAGPITVEKYSGIPPYPETQNYVKRVLNFYETFQKEK